ncbi:S8 family serine peptidase [Leptolyngbya sp. FACHB-541]|uniref:S8 family serine peptidase n=1 Tax=Leptolyngbya sp. FACHB-541 TaxID=2692810 RepID=UPI0016852495|nr:S8 family serine peptidase [Leptolyngbya sp. FACHB-541]MBD1999166.1 S8 family serine peptidase [Leptolyngbya sp. FACHB-541]
MTGSVNPPGSPELPNDSGVLPESEGVILQRGGEELALEKVGDRFTVRPIPNRSLTELARQVGAVAALPVPSGRLIELQVAPDQLDRAMQIARTSEDVSFASHVYHVQNNPSTRIYLTDQITIQFATQMDGAGARAIATSLGLELEQAVAGIPNTYVFQVTQQAPANPVKLANQLMRRADVLTAEPNVVIKTQKLYRPNDSQYPKQWYLQNNGGSRDLTASSHIAAEAAWDITRGVRSIVVAVADDGFDLNHPDFQGKGKIVAPRDLKRKDFLPMPEEQQENHGTSCAGVAIAEENGEGIVGVAPGCAFMPIRTTGFLDDDAVEQLFNWALNNGASVISCSWGSSAVYFPLSLRQRAAITRAATEGRDGKGCVIVFAAGNANRPVSGEINEQGWTRNLLRGVTPWLSGFAVHPDVIAVAATTSTGKKAVYSNWGTNISVAAPSNNASPVIWFQEAGFVNTAPPVSGNLLGKGVFTSDRLGSAGYDPTGFTQTFGGTSSACPVVAGVAALVLSANPNLTAREVRQILQETADKLVDPDPDPQLGLQKGTYDTNGHSQWFGYGKVNAFKAVQAAQRRAAAPLTASRRIQQQNFNAFNIPDFNLQGIASPIQVSESGLVRDVQVYVDVEHTFLGDLEISLIAPGGQTVLLQNRTLGRRTRLQATYSLQTTAALSQLLNRSATGRWQLRVVDHAQLNTGRLNSWQITLGV